MNLKVGQIAQTAFLTLQCHALDAHSNHPVLNDTDSIDILKVLKEETGFSGFNKNRVKKV